MSIIVAKSLPVNLSRRGFMQAILALGAAPAIVHVANLMPVRAVVAATEADFQRVIATKGFLPEIWSTELIKQFYENTVAERLCGIFNQERYDVTQQDIFKAMKEGRIKQSGQDNYYKTRWGFTARDLGKG